MARLPAGWIFIPKFKDMTTITVEQRELVRCAECKHLFDSEHTENCCDVLMEKADWLVEISVNPDWFCANGERKGE